VSNKIVSLARLDLDLIEQISHMLFECFQEFAPDWLPTMNECREEVLESLDPDRVSRVLVDGKQNVLGWIGAIPDENVWEIHPIAVAPTAQRKGYGDLLVNDIAELARSGGAVAIWAGTSDETNATSLSRADLYKDPLGAVQNITAKPNHPIHFWQKAGFTLVGIMPDEEGLGKPGIHFARRIV
jgi:aminoglycoside 6'-N-acetyltransferase I